MSRAYVFDAYGTLLDIHAAVRRHGKDIGPDFQAFSNLWRSKQLEYSWVDTLMDQYVDFWTLTQEALDFALASFPVIEKSLRARLLDAYLRLDAHSDVADALHRLRADGAKLGILSNGSPTMLERTVSAAGLTELLDDVFSVDTVRLFKTHPLAYAIIKDRWGLGPDQVFFVSSNRWDIAGAQRAGFHTIWLNRDNLPDEYLRSPPAKTIRSMADLAAI